MKHFLMIAVLFMMQSMENYLEKEGFNTWYPISQDLMPQNFLWG